MELTTVDKSEFEELVKECTRSGSIDQNLYIEYDVKRGLRDSNGNGVLTGLTEISDVCSTKMIDGKLRPADGELYYRGYNVKDIIDGTSENSHFGFEECTYLLLFGKLPARTELTEFTKMLSEYRTLPTSFVRDIIMKAPSKDMQGVFSHFIPMMTLRMTFRFQMYSDSVYSL